MSGVLLVTGSRSLALTRESEAWARAILEPAVRECSRLVTGDASGPDTWASVYAQQLGKTSVLFRVDGTLTEYRRGASCNVLTSTWAERESLTMWGPKRVPLHRNAAMVASVAARFPGATCLALIDPDSRTRGTMHTVNLAKRAGLLVEIHTYGGHE